MSKRFKAKVEKICPHEKSSYSRYLKQRANRTMRRWAKKDPENAPKKTPHWGWSM